MGNSENMGLSSVFYTSLNGASCFSKNLFYFLNTASILLQYFIDAEVLEVMRVCLLELKKIAKCEARNVYKYSAFFEKSDYPLVV